MAKSAEHTPATRPKAAANDARYRILDAAENQFAEHGFDATPTARIAAEAGVPKGLLFYYFPKKIDIRHLAHPALRTTAAAAAVPARGRRAPR
jgi:AcrR family transcriptional regulator